MQMIISMVKEVANIFKGETQWKRNYTFFLNTAKKGYELCFALMFHSQYLWQF